jgi:hypothetical protein
MTDRAFEVGRGLVAGRYWDLTMSTESSTAGTVPLFSSQ